MKTQGGVILVQGCDKTRVTHGKNSVVYDVGKGITVPLQFGDGTYTVERLKRVAQNKYSVVKKDVVNASGTDSYLTAPNVYVPANNGSWDFSMTEWGSKSVKDAYIGVTTWARQNLVYDWIKAATVPKKGVAPDPEGCWETKRGICQDIASLVTGMLRAAGVPARMVIGLANGRSHAWVEAMVDGKWRRYDHSGTAKSYQRQRWY